MTVSAKHKFQSAKSDGSDPTQVQPSNWNDEHALTCSGNSLLGNSTGTSGNVVEVPCTAYGRSLIACADAAAAATLLNIAALIQSAFPTAMICGFGTSTPPTGWLECNGAAVSRTTYSALFALIGTTFGVGDGSTTFGLPDLRGAFPRGFDHGRGLDSGRVFGSYQGDDYPSHTHPVTDDGHTHDYTAGGASTGFAGSSGAPVPVALSAPAGATTTSHKANITIGSGGGTASEVRPKNVALLFCIKT